MQWLLDDNNEGDGSFYTHLFTDAELKSSVVPVKDSRWRKSENISFKGNIYNILQC